MAYRLNARQMAQVNEFEQPAPSHELVSNTLEALKAAEVGCLEVGAAAEELIAHRLHRLQMGRVEGFKRRAQSHELVSHTLETLKSTEVH